MVLQDALRKELVVQLAWTETNDLLFFFFTKHDGERSKQSPNTATPTSCRHSQVQGLHAFFKTPFVFFFALVGVK